MIISDDYIYLHVPKTAGKAISKFIIEEAFFANAKIHRYRKHLHPKRYTAHFPFRKIHDQLDINLEGKDFFASVRNPLAWYVSLYHYDLPNRSKRFLEFLGDEKDEKVRFRNWLKRMLAADNPHHLGLKRANELKLGLYGYWHAFYTFNTLDFGDNEHIINNYEKLAVPKFYLRVEKLNEDLAKHFGIITTVPKTNKSKHAHFKHYYDQETRDLVLSRDKYIFDKHY